MLHRFFETIREIGDASGFETYYGNILRRGLAGVPTAEEARKDYEEFPWFVSEYSNF